MAKVNIDITANDQASAKIKGLTGSLIGANAAYDILKTGIKAVVDIGKMAIDSFIVQEDAERQLEQRLISTGMAAGITKNELLLLADSLSQVTTFGDEAIIGAENLMLTFTSIGKEVMPTAIETVLDMSTALGQDLKSSSVQLGKALNDPINGMTALSRVGVSFTEDQKKVIKSMQESGDVAGAQKVILTELNKEFGGSARAARETFGGALKSLNNTQGDLLEIGGELVSVIGKDFVKAMDDSTRGLINFIKESNAIDSIAAGFEVFKSIISDIVNVGFKPFGEMVKSVMEKIKSLSKENEKSIGVFDILGAVTSGLSAQFAIFGKVVGFAIDTIINLVKIIKNAGEVVGTFWDFMKGDASWKEVKSAVGEVGDAFKNLAIDATSGIIDIVKTTGDEFSKLISNSETTASKYESVWKNALDKTKQSFSNSKDSVLQSQQDQMNGISSAQNAITEEMAEQLAIRAEAQTVANEETLTKLEEQLIAEQEMTAEALEQKRLTFEDVWGAVVSIITDALSIAQEAVNQYFEQQIANIQKSLSTEVAAIQAAASQQMQIEGVAEETQSQRIAREIAELQAKLTTETDAEKKAQIQKELDNKLAEQRRVEILEDANDKIAAAEETAAAKERAEKLKAFRANKAFTIANIWVNAALSVMGWWAAFAGMGIPGIVLAGVMTGVTLAMAGVQTGLVASQQFQGAQGGVIPAGAGTATGDNVTIGVNPMERILTPQQNKAFESMAFGGGGGGGFNNYGSITVVANSPDEFKEQLINIRHFEMER